MQAFPPRRTTSTITSLELRGITKRFPGVIANDTVNLSVHGGEIHALLGENGAGKSTLMKILYGLYQPDAGEVRINDQPVTISSPQDAIARGIGMIHQHFMLVPSLTVAENIALGLRSSRGLRLDLDRVSAEVQRLAELYGLRVDPKASIWQLSVGEQQRVEILKALYRGAELLVLDEPTAVITPQEVDDLFAMLRQMRTEGRALIFISHKLREVIALSDRVSVLRDGRLVGTFATAGKSRSDLARLMVGREVVAARADNSHPTEHAGSVALELHGISAQSDRNTPALHGVTLQVRAGEILGLAGVSGNGQRELAEVIAGLRPTSAGTIKLAGKELMGNPAERANAGISYIPEERMRDGAVLEFSVAENLILRNHTEAPFARGPLLDRSAVDQAGRDLIQRFNIKTPGPHTPLKSLSGGNIQKVIMARELSREPAVLVAAQPTRGVDIGATAAIHQLLIELRQRGGAILLISEDLDEILALADRIAVIHAGNIAAILPHAEATPERLGLLMAGVASEVT
ncbi:ABC transporter ATP-binding protein [Candidatus Chloroploca sp. M-50]|uniref:ABC transporter ATP-binding protein n=1 Tax=Candidatus Chloroploca mongolica TaxID=2528176 RepID=A0ABS4D9L6_9CHLR|nr:ABC transporter ATP-binding protein [Candidatus Chloroploca mongolica]MBP1466110.1 ABC transporter ATP-binding protein [Candidatus Chloroploca mongolica]